MSYYNPSPPCRVKSKENLTESFGQFGFSSQSCFTGAGQQLNGEKVVREERMIKGQIGRIRDVGVGPDGLVYLLTDEREGVVVRLEAVK